MTIDPQASDNVQLDQNVIDRFADEGVVVIRGAFQSWVECLRDGIERNLKEPGPYARRYTAPGQTGQFVGDYCNWQRIPEYELFIRNSPAGAVAGQLMGAREVRIFHEHVLVKEPQTGERTPWHHDQPYYSVDGWLNCSLWLTLDAVPASVCPEFIAGSHRWKRWFLPRKFSGNDYVRPHDALEPLPDFDGERDQYQIVSFDLEPGDAVAFHFLTVHAAPANPSLTTRRRAFSSRWLGEDAVWAERSGETSPPFPELEGRLRAGDKLDVEQFPVIWRALTT